MSRGGFRAGAGRPKGAKTVNIRTPFIGTALVPLSPNDNPELPKAKSMAAKTKLTPLAFMLQVIADEGLDLNLRLRAAACAAPYVHARKQETGVGKKERDQETAKEAAVGKYLPPEAPGVYSPLN